MIGLRAAECAPHRVGKSGRVRVGLRSYASQRLCTQRRAPSVFGPSHRGLHRARWRVIDITVASGDRSALTNLLAPKQPIVAFDRVHDVQQRDRLEAAGQAEPALRSWLRYEQARLDQSLQLLVQIGGRV